MHHTSIYTAPKGIYPLSGSSNASVVLGSSVSLQWVVYDIPQSSLGHTYTDNDGITPPVAPHDLTLTRRSPPCVSPGSSVEIVPSVPQLASVSVAAASMIDAGTYTVNGEGISSNILLTGKLLACYINVLLFERVSDGEL